MEITIKTTKKQEIIDITNLVKKAIKIKNGIVNIFVQHATAAIIIQENYDPNVGQDILECLSKSIPQGIWKHDKCETCDRENAAAHIKSSILGPSETIPIEDGKLLLGQWQNIMLVELDGPRERNLIIQQIESTK
jgi:secondary thiamine-phosphate synthase enzyme